MSRILVEYNPVMSLRAYDIIRDAVSPSMIADDGDTYQYDIDMVAECLADNDLIADINAIDALRLEGVNYIEI